jgi:hypothetical protein
MEDITPIQTHTPRKKYKTKYETPEERKLAHKLQIKMWKLNYELQGMINPEIREKILEQRRRYKRNQYQRKREQIAIRGYERKIEKLKEEISQQQNLILDIMEDIEKDEELPPLEEAVIEPDDDEVIELSPLNVMSLRGYKPPKLKTIGIDNIFKNLDPAEIGYGGGLSSNP